MVLFYKPSKRKEKRTLKTRKRLTLAFMVIAVVLLALSGAPVAADDPSGFCWQCEDNCYRHSDSVRDYNACVLLCNYAGNCGIPLIQ